MMIKTFLKAAVLAATVSAPVAVQAAEAVRASNAVVKLGSAQRAPALPVRAGAPMEDANQAAPFGISWLVLGLIGTGVTGLALARIISNQNNRSNR